ncbi:hypothetical protein KA013_01310 [Patescibacteria group bacterium]|nr:hypothetical protein [Patescibacteria group bacterium]
MIRLYSISEFDMGLLKKLLEIDPYSEEIGLLVIQNPHTTLQEKLINYQKGVTMKPLMVQALQPHIADTDLHELLELEKSFLLSLY